MIKKMFFGAYIAFFTLLSGCASVPMASQPDDAKAKEFTANPNKANLYIYRNERNLFMFRNETMATSTKMHIFIDGVSAGDTLANTFILKAVEPGEHKIVSQAENEETFYINVKPNHNYYLWQEVSLGAWSTRSNLHEMGETEGKIGVTQCALVK